MPPWKLQIPPLITVIIPVYNAEKHLRRGMDSLLAQTCGDWEAVCINDGSSDNSLSILKEYAAKDARFRVHTQENSGVSAARNRGIQEARGEWITFLDADDWLNAGIIAALKPHTKREKVDIIGFEAEVKFESGIEHDPSLEQAFFLQREGSIQRCMLSPDYTEEEWNAAVGPIDWAQVNDILQREREKARTWLENALNAPRPAWREALGTLVYEKLYAGMSERTRASRQEAELQIHERNFHTRMLPRLLRLRRLWHRAWMYMTAGNARARHTARLQELRALARYLERRNSRTFR